MKIGNVQIHGRLVLAPMAEYTNLPFRLLAKEFGAALVYTEMAMATAIAKKDKREMWLLHTKPNEAPVTAQLCGRDLSELATAAKVIEDSGFSILDLNLCCPITRVKQKNVGGILMSEPQEVAQIVSTVVKSVSMPVTVKIRSGIDSDHINAIEIGKLCEDSGAAAIALHPRTVAQAFVGAADWSLITALKQTAKIPVIGSGDVRSPQDAKRMLEITGCDAVMVARGCLGRPWFFREANHLLTNNTLDIAPLGYDKIKQILLRHWKLLKEHAAGSAVLLLRRHLQYYARSLNCEEFGQAVRNIRTPKEFEDAVREFL